MPVVSAHFCSPCHCTKATETRSLSTTSRSQNVFAAELSMGWVDPWVASDLVGLGRDFSVFGRLGWVGSPIEEVLKF